MSAKRKKATKAKKESRHGKLADNRKQTSITMEKDLMKAARLRASRDGRSLSNWIEQVLRKVITG